MTDCNFQSAGYRPIPGWPTYMLGVDLDVWSLPRAVPCKGGTRQKAGRQLKPSRGRVTLSCNGTQHRFHIANELFPDVFPDVVEQRRQEKLQRPQGWCSKGHPLIAPLDPDALQPKVAYWGHGNRVCLRCHAADAHDDTYSRQIGIHGRKYRGLPEREAFRQRHLLDEFIATQSYERGEATVSGFKVTKKP